MITYSVVNLFTDEDVIQNKTMLIRLGRGNGCKMTKHLSSMGRINMALGLAMNYIILDVRRVGEAGGSPALGFRLRELFKSGRELI